MEHITHGIASVTVTVTNLKHLPNINLYIQLTNKPTNLLTIVLTENRKTNKLTNNNLASHLEKMPTGGNAAHLSTAATRRSGANSRPKGRNTAGHYAPIKVGSSNNSCHNNYRRCDRSENSDDDLCRLVCVFVCVFVGQYVYLCVCR